MLEGWQRGSEEDAVCCFSCRELYESGLRAFVSFVHFYYKHECKLIFQPKSKGRGGRGERRRGDDVVPKLQETSLV